MVYLYTCKNKICAEREGTVFRLEIPSEAVLDDHNLATIFCRKCGKALTNERTPKNGENE